MPLYDLVCIARHSKQAFPGLSRGKPVDDAVEIVKPLMKTAAIHVMNNGGVVRGFQSLPGLNLPYRMRRHQEIFETGRTWSMQFDASPATMAGLRKALSFDERVIRYTVIKLGDSLKEVTGAYSIPTMVNESGSTPTESGSTPTESGSTPTDVKNLL
ncbi:hypothetical protein BDR26DRAFT_863319 [Obelidium mucronatum]|nr:hypothetical protein BDR26DRAFT_863319 [Obelidium mucronatum]